MLLTDLRRDELGDGRAELSVTVRFDDDAPGRAWIRVSDVFAGPDPHDASPFVVGLLLLCMRRGEDLQVKAPVSPRPEDRDAVARAVPGLDAEPRAALKQARGAAEGLSAFPAPLRGAVSRCS